MKLDSTSFVDQMTANLKKYTHTCSAAALFYAGHNPDLTTAWGLRLECPAIGKEFKDNIAFGKDPEGFLLYYGLDDFDTTEKSVKYHSFYNTESPRAVRVDFYALKANGNEESNPFCTFITNDTSGLSDTYVTSSNTNDGKGVWKSVTLASSYGKVRKGTSSDEVTILMSPIGKEIVIDAKGYTIAKSIDLIGTFTFPDLNVIKAGSYKVDFNPDRVVLYDSTNQDTVVGFFIPVDAMAGLQDTTKNTATIKDVTIGN